MYFAGEGINSLTLEDRMTLTNMAIEAGGKNGICDVDEKTLAYVRNRSNVPTWDVVEEDHDAKYHFQAEWDLSTMEPMVAKPHSPDNRDTAHNCRDVKARPLLHRLMHRREDHRHDLRCKYPKRESREGADFRRARPAPKFTAT